MQPNPKALEITGKAVKSVGAVHVPAAGTMTVKLTGDILQANVKSGFESTETWLRVQNVDSVELYEALFYLMLGLGVFFALIALSCLGNMQGDFGVVMASLLFGFIFGALAVVCIMEGTKNKRRFLVIHSTRSTIPVFMTKSTDTYRQFATNVMLLARQLNARTPIQAPQAQPPQRNGQHPAVSAKQ